MEKKQLNFDMPLLSARKSASTLGPSDGLNKKIVQKSPPVRQQSFHIPKSGWELGEVTKPAAVPFLWEQIPGRPKGEGGGRPQTPQRSSSTPRLPPGRVSDVGRCSSGQRSMEQNYYKSQLEVYPVHDHAALLESLRESLYANGESDSESLNDVYSDALDSLSLAESLSLNCSLSGLSGFEVPNIKSSGTYCVDPQTKDFMMSRFLPAAKSVVLETPQYIPGKQPIVAEQPKQAKKIASHERKSVLDHRISNLILSHYQYTEDSKSEGEDDEHDDCGKRSGKAWGFFPRLCVNKSLCPLNPVPSMKTRIQTPKSPATDFRRLSRKAYSGTLDKPAWDSSNKRIFHPGVPSQKLCRDGSKLCESNKFSYLRASYRAGGLSPCRPFRSGGISPYRNATPQSPFTNGTRFLGIRTEVENSRNQKYSASNKEFSNALDACSPRVYKQERVSINGAVVKTLYSDSANSVKPIRRLASLEAAKPINTTYKNLEFLAESRRNEEISLANSGIDEVRPLDISKGGTNMDPKSILDDIVLPSSACISMSRGTADKSEGAKLDHGISTEATSSAVNNEPEAQIDLTSAIVQSPLPPPLPKPPSESWLWSTVPSIHLQSPSSHLHPANRFQPKKLGQKASVAGTKWETIVKTSNLRHGHGCYSEEIISHKKNKT